jgi:hypothetical protein
MIFPLRASKFSDRPCSRLMEQAFAKQTARLWLNCHYAMAADGRITIPTRAVKGKRALPAGGRFANPAGEGEKRAIGQQLDGSP